MHCTSKSFIKVSTRLHLLGRLHLISSSIKTLVDKKATTFGLSHLYKISGSKVGPLYYILPFLYILKFNSITYSAYSELMFTNNEILPFGAAV